MSRKNAIRAAQVAALNLTAGQFFSAFPHAGADEPCDFVVVETPAPGQPFVLAVEYGMPPDPFKVPVRRIVEAFDDYTDLNRLKRDMGLWQQEIDSQIDFMNECRWAEAA